VVGNFDAAFTLVLGVEKGFVDDPADPGGATRFGITERLARKHGYLGDMSALPLPIAQHIAAVEFWIPCRCDALPPELAYQVFDAAYNSGPSQAIKWLQEALDVPVDGVFGGATASAIAGAANVDKVVMRYDALRLIFMANLPTWPSFARGWARRIADNLLRAAA
jgi:lysozyme family protein